MSETSLAIIPRSFAELEQLAERLATSSLLPVALRGKVPEVMMTVMAGQELGIPPMAALRSINVIEGKTVLSADIMAATVQSRGACVYVKRVSASDVEATYETLRKGATEPRRVTWTIEQAKKAALHLKDNWRCFPRAMLSARAKSELLRDVYSDVLAGCYTPDEIEDFASVPYSAPPQVTTSTNDAIDAEFTESGPDIAPLLAEIEAAETAEQVKTVAAKCNALPKKTPQREAAMKAFKARQKTLAERPALTVQETTVQEQPASEVAA